MHDLWGTWRVSAETETNLADFEPGRKRVALIAFICGFPLLVMGVVALLPLFVEAPLVHGALYRRWAENGAVREEFLTESGATIETDEQVVLKIETREPMHLYVVGVDGHGRQFTLFPDPVLTAGNPIQPGKTHVFPDDFVSDEAVSNPPRWLWNGFGPSIFYVVYVTAFPVPVLESLVNRLPAMDPSTGEVSAVTDENDLRQEKQRKLTTIQSHMERYKKLRKKSGIWAWRAAVGRK